jgi:hypothetical protein
VTAASSSNSFATVLGYATLVGAIFSAGYGVHALIGQASGMTYVHLSDYISKDELSKFYVDKSIYEKTKADAELFSSRVDALTKLNPNRLDAMKIDALNKLHESSQCAKIDATITDLSSQKEWIEHKISTSKPSQNSTLLVFDDSEKLNIPDLRRKSSELQERIMEATRQLGLCRR